MTTISPKGAPNIPDWTEDANSPSTASGAASIDATVADTADAYLIVVRADSSEVDTGDWKMTMNGGTTGYSSVGNDDSEVSGASSWTLATGRASHGLGGSVVLMDKPESNTFGGECGFNTLFDPGPGGPVYLAYGGAASLDSLSVTHSVAPSISGSIEVFGRDMP